MTWPVPHHDGSALYVSDPYPELGDTVTVFVRTPHDLPRVWVRSLPDGEAEYTPAKVDRRDDEETWWRADLHIRNPITSYRFLLDPYAWLNGEGLHRHDPTDAADFRLTVHDPPPAWAADAAIYQIFPDRFAASGANRPLPPWAVAAAWEDPVRYGGRDALQQLYGGDLAGIQQRLDHIADLGFDTIYLTPFFPAESNHRYNATSFDRVDPLLGGDQALTSLTAAVHARGMRLLGDLTANHCGSRHEWFLAACADPSAPEAEFFTFDEHPGRYDCWLDVPTLPKLDHRSAELRRRLYEGADSVVAHWLRMGLDGWRIDVANMAGRLGAVELNHAVARGIRKTLQAADPDALLVAEHAFDATDVLDGDLWHGIMAYAGFVHPVWGWLRGPDFGEEFLGMPMAVPRMSGPDVAATMTAFRAAVPWRSVVHSWNALGSHDTARFRTVAGSRDRHLAGVVLLYTSPGAPMVFAGDEIGLAGIDNEDARKPFCWDRDRWDQPTYDAYRRLGQLRRDHPALRTGGFRWVHVSDDVLTYTRDYPDETLLVQISRDPAVELPPPPPSSAALLELPLARIWQVS